MEYSELKLKDVSDEHLRKTIETICLHYRGVDLDDCTTLERTVCRLLFVDKNGLDPSWKGKPLEERCMEKGML